MMHLQWLEGNILTVIITRHVPIIIIISDPLQYMQEGMSKKKTTLVSGEDSPLIHDSQEIWLPW